MARKQEEGRMVHPAAVFAAERKAQGLTQKDISALSGIAQGDISRIEAGLANPSIKTLKRIADALGMEMTIVLTKKK